MSSAHPKRPLSDETKRKILICAANILSQHGSLVGNRVCQDWSGDPEENPALMFDAKESDDIEYNHQIENSDLGDYEAGYSPLGDEMCASFAMADMLRDMAKELDDA